MPNTCFYCSGLTGGTVNDLDGLDPLDANRDASGLLLVAGDIAFVVNEYTFRVYVLQSSAGAVQSLPDVVVPTLNPGNFWWQMQEGTLPKIYKYDFASVANNETKNITHPADSVKKRLVFIYVNNVLTRNYDVSLTGPNTLTAKNVSGSAHTNVSVRVVF